jgi:signal transduction histidine kinase
MHPKHCVCWFNSLFTRLALVLLLAAVALNTAAYHFFFSFLQDQETSFNRNLTQYAQFLVRELGAPPDQAKAEELGQRLQMRVTLEGPQPWTAGLSEPFPESKLRAWYASEAVQAARLHGYNRIRVRIARDSTLTFDIYPTLEERARLRRYGFYFLGFTGLIFLAAYGIFRRLLRPVRQLTDAAADVRDGDLSRRAPENSKDELGQLALAFNQMVARLESVLQAQERLLLGVSHELRTPLTRLKLRVEMFARTSENERSAERMREDLREMEAMIASLLNAARLRHEGDSLKRARVDLVPLLRAAAARFQDRPPGVLVLPPEPTAALDAWVDPERLSTALNILLDNAVKYSRPDAKPVELSLATSDGELVLRVRDFGIGVPKDALQHLFEPFYRVDESRARESGGYGLGLHLCQAIIQAHGGSVTVESEQGQGTVAEVRLPNGTGTHFEK